MCAHVGACQQIKSSAHAAVPLARFLPVPSGCWDSISIDFAFCLPKDLDGNTGIVVFVDRLIKISHSAVVPDCIGGKGTALLFIDRMVWQHGLSLSIVSDRGPCFMVKL